MLKKFLKYMWPILLRALMLELEREIQYKLYGKGYSRTTFQMPRKYVRTNPKTSYLHSNPNLGYIGYVFHENETAQEVLDRLKNIIDGHGYVTVADFHELVGETGSFTDQKWGWKNLDDVEIVKDTDEDNDNMNVWVIKMTQRPVPVG